MVVCTNGALCAFVVGALDQTKHKCLVCKGPLHGLCATEITECTYARLDLCAKHKSYRNSKWRDYEVGGGQDVDSHDSLLDGNDKDEESEGEVDTIDPDEVIDLQKEEYNKNTLGGKCVCFVYVLLKINEI